MTGINPNFLPQSKVNQLKLENDIKQTEISAEEVNELVHENIEDKSNTLNASALDTIAAYNQGSIKMVSITSDNKPKTTIDDSHIPNQKLENNDIKESQIDEKLDNNLISDKVPEKANEEEPTTPPPAKARRNSGFWDRFMAGYERKYASYDTYNTYSNRIPNGQAQGAANIGILLASVGAGLKNAFFN